MTILCLNEHKTQSNSCSLPRVAALRTKSRRPPSRYLPAPVALLLAGGRTLAMRYMRNVLRVGLWRSRLALGSLLCFRFCGCMLLTCGVAHCGSGVGFVVTL